MHVEPVVVELTGVPVLDVVGTSTLLATYRHATRRGADIRLFHTTLTVTRVLDVPRLVDTFDVPPLGDGRNIDPEK